MHAEILKPVAILILWSLVMLAWTVVTRMPAMRKAGIDITKLVGGRGHQLDGRLPDRSLWAGHNYVHLMEQPTLFYAAALAIAILGGGGRYAALAAWAYVVLRIVHSFVQTLYNRVIVRFVLFALSTTALVALSVRAVTLAFA
ncbi:hypothetical protein FHS31_000394 [Sphingomonas vulcanisoli]|uniref:MAPEG family protein n=1 Tax=Sphingomonas vulcanisoli TaxID=1658060 RepID=A0ABX0TMS1_9SPHN|nr:MAPEG family protein [Sphingomonas vulcanisoli]NIJ06812.1 hypothetical protein [Sphingomonas vulcanisoli]